LFTIVGNLIHSRFSQQDIREILSSLDRRRTILINFIRILSLRGVVFFSGFFSKEVILVTHYFIINSIVSYLFLLIIISLTLIYCIKLITALLITGIYQPVFHKRESFFRLFPSLILCSIRIYLGYFSFSNIIITTVPLKRLSRLYWITLIISGLTLRYTISLKINWRTWFQSQEQVINITNITTINYTKTFSILRTSSLLERLYLSRSLKSYKGVPLSGYSISIVVIVSIILILL
jgi:NADH:ubiquinone oxidoreductase subunit 5 (subunit L)/multisubunit Na+/H+ antiporter MnhA subunit